MNRHAPRPRPSTAVGSLAALVSAGLSAFLWQACAPRARAAGAAIQAATTLPLGLDWDPTSYAYRSDVRSEVLVLGRELFFDGRMSRSGAMSCATCHDPERGFADGRTVVVGDSGSVGTRNVPSILNRAMGRSHFWDGRADTLAEQALGPILAESEMGMTEELFAQRFTADPRQVERFERAFGAPPSLELVARAIAAFEATLVTAEAPFDRFEWLGEREALGPEAQRGLALFRGKAGCSTCHTGTNFTDEKLHDIGIPGESGPRQFKTPSLRNVTRTAPYMHDGSLATLDEVVRYYDQGGKPHPGLDPEIRLLKLSAPEQGELVAFLGALEGRVVALESALFTGEAR